MAFTPQTINKELDMANLSKHNANYSAIKTELDAHDGRITANADATSDAQSDIDTHVADQVAHLTSAEHVKLTGIEAGAEVNQNAFAQVNNVTALSKSDTLTVEGGIGITVSTNPSSRKLTITATGDAAPGAHGSTHDIDGSDPIPDLVLLREDFDSFSDRTNIALKDFVSARDYGVLGDGVTDDTTSFQNAVTANPNKILLIPEGVLRLTDSIQIDHPIRIMGMGTGLTKLRFEGMGGFGGKSGFVVSISSGKYDTYSVSDMTISIVGGNGASAIKTPRGSAIFNLHAPTYVFERLKFTGGVENAALFGLFDYGWNRYIDIGDSRETVIRDVSVYGCYDYTVDPAIANTSSTAFYLSGNQNEGGVLMPIVDHCFAHYCGVSYGFGYRVSNPKIVNSQAHRCYDGLDSPNPANTSTDYGVLELQVSNVNINAQRRGIRLEKTSYADFTSIRVTRANGGFDHNLTWYGFYLNNVYDAKIHSYRAYNEGSSYTNQHVGVYFSGSDYVSLSGGYYTAATPNGLSDALVLNDTTRIDIFGINVNNAVRGVSVTTASTFSPEMTIVGDYFTSSVGTHLTYGSGITRHRIQRLRKSLVFGVVDDSLTGVSAAATINLSVGADAQVRRYQFNTGSGAYTYAFNLNNDGAIEGDTFLFHIRLTGSNPTVVFNDGTGALQLTLNSATSKSYRVEMVFTGQQWRCISACESIV